MTDDKGIGEMTEDQYPSTSSGAFRYVEEGFSLIEQLIVVTVIGIIASIAIPSLLQSEMAATKPVR